jgi:hypothetical protein
VTVAAIKDAVFKQLDWFEDTILADVLFQSANLMPSIIGNRLASS